MTSPPTTRRRLGPPTGPRPPWSIDGPTPGTPPPAEPGSTPPYASAGAQPPPPRQGAGRVPTDGDLWGERGTGADQPTSPSKPRSTAAKGWVGAGVGAVAIVGAALFGINAAGSSPSGTQAGPAAYGAPGYGMPMAATGGGYGMPGGGPGSGGQTSRMGVAGTVASVSDTSFTVKGGGSDPVTVKVTDDTTITKVGEDGQEEKIELADLKVGDTVMVRGEQSGDAIAATVVRVGELPGAPGHGPLGPR